MIKRFSTKVDISLVSKLRKSTECSMVKAKEVLLKHNNDYDKALAEINQTSVNFEKLKNRIAQEGLIGVSHHHFGLHSALVEVNCETDFVAKNDLYTDFCKKLAQTTALFNQSSLIDKVDVEELKKRSLVDGQDTVEEELLKVIGKLKEKIDIRRAFVSSQTDLKYLTAAYSHGRLGSLVLLESANPVELKDREPLTVFAKQLAQHITGFNPISIDPQNGSPEDQALVNQDFLFGGGKVSDLLQSKNLSVKQFIRIECGEGIERKTVDFAAEVLSQIK